MNRASRRAAGAPPPFRTGTHQPPTPGQRNLIAGLAADLGIRAAKPRTRRQADAEIDALLIRRRKP